MNTNLQRVKDAIYNSNLSFLEQDELVDLFSHANDEELTEVANLLKEDPSMLKILSDNYQVKQAVFAAGTPELWKKLVEGEEAQLQKIAEN
jgi:hypothetical protein